MHVYSGGFGRHDGQARLRVLADPSVVRLEIIVDGCRALVAPGASLAHDLTLTPGHHFVYVRAVREDEQRAWTSPVYLRDEVP
jgi:hypothetical protein